MLFNSVIFLLVFLPVSLILYDKAKQHSQRSALLVLLVGSLVFYSWWDWRFTPLLLGSILLNFTFGKLFRDRRSAGMLTLGIALNLLPLCFFKYAGWLTTLAGSPNTALTSLVLPLGISFFTFLQIGYLTCIYKGTLQDRGFLPYAVFVTYFPHLIAGPILQHNEVTAQLVAIDKRPLQMGESFGRGLLLLVVGLFKKIIIADMACASLANSMFGMAQTADFTQAWTGALAYSAQLYFDFSGYCEMALGMSLLFGIAIPINFLSPYRAPNIADFWRRWHISLSMWFRDHVYVPLGGNRNGPWIAMMALAVTFFLTGLWHGAGLTFVAWGVLHGGYVAVYRVWRSLGRPMPLQLAKFITLVAVIFAWVLFRAGSLSDAMQMWSAMVGVKGITLGPGFAPYAQYLPTWVNISGSAAVIGTEVILYGMLLAWCATAKNVHEFVLMPTFKHASLIFGMALIAMFAINRGSTFLYFSF